MTMDADRIQQIAAWLAATDIAQLELCGPGVALALRQDAGAVSVVDIDTAEPEAAAEAAAADLLTVTAPSVGVFLHRHPLREQPLAAPGTPVRAGQALGLLQIGLLLLPVPAPADGSVHELLAAHGSIVGYGTPLLALMTRTNR